MSIETIRTLDELFSAMRANDQRTIDQHGQFRSDLPTFGSTEPDGTGCVWSWDERRMIVGTCGDDLEIVER